jgi:hypothetical protein
MQNETMTPAEAMDAVQRLRITLVHVTHRDRWAATVWEPHLEAARADTAIGAVEALVLRLAQRKTVENRVADAIEKAEATFAHVEGAVNN